jgi:DNA-binding transcriptional LysR family regulator
VCRLVECNVGIGIVPESTARRVQKTNAIAVVPLADPWAVRELTICTRKLDELPLYARQLVEHLRSNSPVPKRRVSAKHANSDGLSGLGMARRNSL